MARVFIGTSGWHYAHWRERFYPHTLPTAAWLRYYATHLDSVEVNNSFYRLLDAAAVRNWRRQVPREFVFAVKGSRYLTHNKKLKDAALPLRRFFTPVRAFGRALGPVVFQTPPAWRVNAPRLESFLRLLSKRRGRRRYSFEFRNESWHCEEVYALLRRFNAAFCIYELAGAATPYTVTADFVYARLHGPSAQKYQGLYSAAALRRWAQRIEAWADVGLDVYLYFDNDQNAYAVDNAIALRSYLHPRLLRKR